MARMLGLARLRRCHACDLLALARQRTGWHFRNRRQD